MFGVLSNHSRVREVELERVKCTGVAVVAAIHSVTPSQTHDEPSTSNRPFTSGSIRSSDIDEWVEKSTLEFNTKGEFTIEQLAEEEERQTRAKEVAVKMARVDGGERVIDRNDAHEEPCEAISAEAKNHAVEPATEANLYTLPKDSVEGRPISNAVTTPSDHDRNTTTEEVAATAAAKLGVKMGVMAQVKVGGPQPPPPLKFKPVGQAAVIRRRLNLLKSFPREVGATQYFD